MREIRRFDGLVTGSKVNREGVSETLVQGVGLKKWIQSNGYQDDPLLISSVYLHHFTAPGEWCQLFWECSTQDVARRLKEKLPSSDLSGEYLLGRLLSDLTKEEVDYYQRTCISA